MAYKGVVDGADYKFSAANKTIRFVSGYIGMSLSDIMYITNIKSGTATVIYDPSDAAKGGTLSGLVLTLAYDTTAMADGDSLQIIVGDSSLDMAVGLNNLSAAIKRMLDMLARPSYMSPIGEIRVQAGASPSAVTVNGSLTTLVTLTSLTGMGAALVDQSFSYYTLNREAFNIWKNNIIN